MRHYFYRIGRFTAPMVDPFRGGEETFDQQEERVFDAHGLHVGFDEHGEVGAWYPVWFRGAVCAVYF